MKQLLVVENQIQAVESQIQDVINYEQRDLTSKKEASDKVNEALVSELEELNQALQERLSAVESHSKKLVVLDGKLQAIKEKRKPEDTGDIHAIVATLQRDVGIKEAELQKQQALYQLKHDELENIQSSTAEIQEESTLYEDRLKVVTEEKAALDAE